MRRKITVGALLCCLWINAYSLMFWSNTVKSDEEIIFFPSLGVFNKQENTWQVEVHGWIFEPALLGDLTYLFRKATGIKKQKDEDPSFFKRRSAGFLVDNERGKRITVKIGDQNHVIGNRSAPNGHFSGQLKLSTESVRQFAKDDSLTFTAVLTNADQRKFVGRIFLVPDTGYSVISDIDDTIKISNVHDKKQLLLNTFFRPFVTAPGMADYYQLLANLPDASFHYVSASPWQLYRPLEKFRAQHNFPPGSYHMKLFRFKDRSITNLFVSPIKYKLNIIAPLIQQYPDRKFILIGDSGEKDPEVYGEIARRYTKQVTKILIRNVSETDPERYQKAFAGLPKKKWVVFLHPDEIP